ncbi:MAG TPA: hypothetical protein PKM48_14050, partial [Parvularculaceae bacterium]|nr:hypothetical protein [Parvularculaceae bacterium]
MQKTSLAAIALAAIAGMAEPANALDIRFYPGDRVYAYQLDGQRGTNSILVQNIAVINDSAAPVALNDVTLELLSAGRATEMRKLGQAELAAAAANGAGLQQGGFLDILKFQFGGDRLLPAGTSLSPDLTLDPGEAVLVSWQAFAFRGARDAVRVTANGADARELPVSMEQSQIAYSFPLRGAWYVGAG